jgi:fibronectin type 3 domain-containing protein
VKGPAKGALSFVSKDLRGMVTIAMTGVGVNGGAQLAKSSHTVALGWEASPGNVEGYNVYRGEGASTAAIYTRLTASPVSTLNYRDADVASGTEYQYFVTSVSPTGAESAHSDGVSVTIPKP